MLTRSQLRDLAKFGAGLIAADFLVGVWMLGTGLIPYEFFGIVLTEQVVLLWLLFDVVLLLALIMFGWHVTDKNHTTMQKAFFQVLGVLFAVIGLVHLARIAFQWDFVIAGWEVPMWVNALGVAVTLFLSYSSFHFAAGKKK